MKHDSPRFGWRSPGTIDQIFHTQSSGVDLVLGLPLHFGNGYGLPCPDIVPYIPAGRRCFWGGWGGSLVVNDLDNRLTFTFAMNRMGEGTLGDDRALTLLAAALAAIGAV